MTGACSPGWSWRVPAIAAATTPQHPVRARFGPSVGPGAIRYAAPRRPVGALSRVLPLAGAGATGAAASRSARPSPHRSVVPRPAPEPSFHAARSDLPPGPDPLPGNQPGHPPGPRGVGRPPTSRRTSPRSRPGNGCPARDGSTSCISRLRAAMPGFSGFGFQGVGERPCRRPPPPSVVPGCRAAARRRGPGRQQTEEAHPKAAPTDMSGRSSCIHKVTRKPPGARWWIR